MSLLVLCNVISGQWNVYRDLAYLLSTLHIFENATWDIRQQHGEQLWFAEMSDRLSERKHKSEVDAYRGN